MNVPKFASFRPKLQPTPKVSPPPKDGDSSRSNGHTHDRPRPDKRRRSRSRERKHATPEISLPREKPLAKLEVFVVDRGGDEKNLIYGSVHRYSVPPFYRIGAGSVLGVPRQFKIQRDLSDERGLLLSDARDPRARKREKYVFSKMDQPRLLKFRPEAVVDEGSSLQADFMSLELPRVRKRKWEAHSALEKSDSEDELQDYRSIHGKAKTDQPSDPAFQYAEESESSELGDTMKDSAAARRKNAELNRKVEQSPHDIEAWLALIAYQDAILRGDGDQRRFTNAEEQSTADIKIHMYEKALEQANCLADRERLLQGIMTTGSKIWEVKTQTERWEQIARDNIDSLVLWRNYLDFKQSTFTTFRYEEVREAYVDRFKLLLKEIAVGSMNNSDALYEQLIYVLLRFTLFLRESGYTELSVAIWQASLDINFRSPASYEDLKADFREYWESEVSRFGEVGSLGWDGFHRDTDKAEAAPVQIDEQLDFTAGDVLFNSWANAERLRQKTSHVPAKTMDETVEDDPFRVILFSDIEEFIFALPKWSETLRQSLFDAFLRFCRLPPITSKNSDWNSDRFVRGEILETSYSWIKAQYRLSSHEDEEKPIVSALKPPSNGFATSPDTLFSDCWYTSMEPWNEVYSGNDNGPVSYRWLRNSLQQLLAVHSSDELAEYILAFEWKNEPKSIKKTAKGLIRSHSDSLRLYNAYAMIEWSRDNKDIAATIFAATLKMDVPMKQEKKVETILIWKSWTWACIGDGDNASALKNILSITDGVPPPSAEISPTAFIRAKQHLTSNRDYLLTSGDSRHSVMYAECLFLLEYLSTQTSSQGDITIALSSISNFTQTMTDRNLAHSTDHELFLQSAARLLFHHARTGPFRPALLRSELGKFLSSFPNNSIFLSLFSWNETRFKIEGRVRNLLSTTSTNSPLFKIKWEMENGTIHSVRAAFEAILSSNTSAAIWKLYIIFTVDRFKTKAKDVWYRALRACPWAKELYMTGFELLDHKEVGFEELKGTWKIMSEKELRVHVDLEEEFEDLAGR